MGDWRKSSYSDASGGQCIEVASADMIMIRDTTSRGGFTLAVSGTTWTEFLATLR